MLLTRSWVRSPPLSTDVLVVLPDRFSTSTALANSNHMPLGRLKVMLSRLAGVCSLFLMAIGLFLLLRWPSVLGDGDASGSSWLKLQGERHTRDFSQ